VSEVLYPTITLSLPLSSLHRSTLPSLHTVLLCPRPVGGGALSGDRRPSSVRLSICLMSRTSALTRKPKGLGRRNFAQGTPGHMRLSHRLQGQKVKSQGGVGAYCGGHLAAQLVTKGLVVIENGCITATKLLVAWHSSSFL